MDTDRKKLLKEHLGVTEYKWQKERNSGRTIRLLKQACKFIDEGKRVLIIVENQLQVSELSFRISVFFGKFPENITLITPHDIDCEVNWFNMTVFMRGKEFDEVLFDTYPIERRFYLLLRELHRFDLDD